MGDNEWTATTVKFSPLPHSRFPMRCDIQLSTPPICQFAAF